MLKKTSQLACVSHKLCSEVEQTVISDKITDASVRPEDCEICRLEFESFQKFDELVHGVFLRPQRGELTAEKIFPVFPVQHLVLGVQCHDKTVKHVIDEDLEKEIEIIGECDGIITKERGVGIAIKHADCQAALFYDPIEKVIAGVHCGWRGSVKNIYSVTVEKLVNEFHCKRKNLRVCISPSLGPNAAEFIHYRKEFPEAFYPFQVKPTYFDFWAISREQLLQLGILDAHIEIAGLCTYANPKDFYSYRRRKNEGRNYSVIALLPN